VLLYSGAWRLRQNCHGADSKNTGQTERHVFMKDLLTLTIRMLAVVVLFCHAAYAAAGDKEYVIGADDVLEINFWQDPSLDTRVKVGQDGKISLDIIGQVEAAGKTTEALRSDIVRQMSRLNKNISQAVVRVAEYHYNHVYVTGQVSEPGKRSFEEIPGLWALINESGGVTEFGDLTRVAIIRGGDEAGKVEVVNVSEAIASGDLTKLPKVRRMDTIEIPRRPAVLPASDLSQPAEKKNVVYVIGAVNSPGAVNYEAGMDVLEALALAGGPTDAADLKRSRLVIQDGNYAQTIGIDLERYAERGRPARYMVQREDTFIIPARRPGFLGTGIGTVAGILGAAATLVIIYDRLTADEGGTTPAASGS
jgi:polysaccharide export outer membrane protein